MYNLDILVKRSKGKRVKDWLCRLGKYNGGRSLNTTKGTKEKVAKHYKNIERVAERCIKRKRELRSLEKALRLRN